MSVTYYIDILQMLIIIIIIYYLHLKSMSTCINNRSTHPLSNILLWYFGINYNQ